MREIKFRGQTEVGAWLIGDLVHRNGSVAIRPIGDYGSLYGYKVKAETVGEWTGFEDGAGQEIYEGDILIEEKKAQENSTEEWNVKWDEEGGCWALTTKGKFEEWLTDEIAKKYVAIERS